MHSDKLRRLEDVARKYYEQNKTQAEIAKELNVSRPLISRMLDEARQAGIVEIRIHSKTSGGGSYLFAAKEKFGLKGGFLAAEGKDNLETNMLIGNGVLSLIEEAGGGHVGIGWGHIIGTVVSILENRPEDKTSITDICPMVGNSWVSIRHYHSNENTRIFAAQTKSNAHYLYTPALAETKQDLELLKQTEQYKSILKEWQNLDIALVNIGEHPSTPDFASGARYGNLLTKHKAIGRLIAYYFNSNGEIIHSDKDYIIQIPLEILKNCKNVIGICSANVSARVLKGALNTKILTHIVAREKLFIDICN